MFGNRPCLGVRHQPADEGPPSDYRFLTYREVCDRVQALGSGLMGLGLSEGDTVGILCENQPEWVIIEQACYAYSLVAVPLYTNLKPEHVRYIIQQAKVKVVFASESSSSTSVLEDLSSIDAPDLEYIVSIPSIGYTGGISTSNYRQQSGEERDDGVESESDPSAVIEGLVGTSTADIDSNTMRYKKVPLRVLEMRGESLHLPHLPPNPSSIATICYTSGTTGVPKGAILTHSNILSNAASVHHQGIDAFPSDVYFSYLPLAHMFERIALTIMLGNGAAVGFYNGDVHRLIDDMRVLRPTIFPGVPRVFNKLCKIIIAEVRKQPTLARMAFKRGFQAKSDALNEHGTHSHMFWDNTVFRSFSNMIGGKVRLMVCGSAPVAASVVSFLRVVMSCPFLEGYGMTECSAICTLQLNSDDTSRSNVGIPLVCNEIKLVDVPEMGYTSRHERGGVLHPQGEICVRGTNVFKGFFNQPELTAKVLTQDGWIHTGDIGMWLPDQTLKIIDRKKNILKLAQGEYIAYVL